MPSEKNSKKYGELGDLYVKLPSARRPSYPAK